MINEIEPDFENNNTKKHASWQGLDSMSTVAQKHNENTVMDVRTQKRHNFYVEGQLDLYCLLNYKAGK